MRLRLFKLSIGGCIAFSSLTFLGCTTVPRDSGFGDVEKLVNDRVEKRIHWNQGSQQDQQVAAMIQSAMQKEMTADEAVQIALLNNRNLQAIYEDLGIAQAELVQAGLLRNPVFEAIVRFPDRAPKGPDVELSVTQDFMDILFIPARKKLAAAGFAVAKLKVAGAVVNHAADTKAAFYKLQGALQMIELRRTVVQSTEISADLAKRLFDAGNIADLNLSGEQALSVQATLDLAEAEAEAMEDRERLNVLMGLSEPNLQWKLATKLPDIPQTDPQAQGMEAAAMSQRLDLGAAKTQIEVTAKELGLSRQYWFLPEFSIGVDTERDPGGTRVTGPTVAAMVPIFDQGQARLAAGSAKWRQAQQQYQALETEIKSQVRAANNRMQAARKRAEYLQKTVVPLRTKIVEQTQLRYNGMLMSLFQLLEAKQAQIDAGRDYIEAVRRYWLARTELERAVGGSLKVMEK